MNEVNETSEFCILIKIVEVVLLRHELILIGT